MNKSVLILGLGDIYWTKFALIFSKLLQGVGIHVVIVLESRVGEYQAYLERCSYDNASVYYLSDFAMTYKPKHIAAHNIDNVMCDYLRVKMHGHMQKLYGTDWGMVSQCVEDFASYVYTTENVGLVISDQVSTSLSYTFCNEASNREIEFWGLSGSRLPGRYVSTSTVLSESKVVESIYQEIISGDHVLTEEESAWAYGYINSLDKQVPDYMRSARLNKLSLGKFIKKQYLKMILGSIVYSLNERVDKKYILIKSAPITTIFNSTISNIARLFKAKYIRRYFSADVEKSLNDSKYYVYPIHYQPEASTVVGSPFYTDQLNIITNLAFSLPSGVKLVVKEHLSNVGLPTIEFYKVIKSLPNVVLVWHEENIKNLIKKSLGVITLTGTAGFEALLLDKPVYYFGDVFYTYHPNAMRISDWKMCKEQLSNPRMNCDYDNAAFLVAYRRYTIEGKLDFMKNDFGIAQSLLEKIQLKWNVKG